VGVAGGLTKIKVAHGRDSSGVHDLAYLPHPLWSDARTKIRLVCIIDKYSSISVLNGERLSSGPACTVGGWVCVVWLHTAVMQVHHLFTCTLSVSEHRCWTRRCTAPRRALTWTTGLLRVCIDQRGMSIVTGRTRHALAVRRAAGPLCYCWSLLTRPPVRRWQLACCSVTRWTLGRGTARACTV